MTSHLGRLRALARAYSSLATALAPRPQDGVDAPAWEDALFAALECLDARQAEVLVGVMETVAAGDPVVPPSELGIRFPPECTADADHRASTYMRHAGSTAPLWWHEYEGHVAAQADVSAGLAWEEVTCRTGRHPVQAAKASQWRREFLQMHLVPTVVADLKKAEGMEAGLLTLLAWVADHDLRHPVRP